MIGLRQKKSIKFMTYFKNTGTLCDKKASTVTTVIPFHQREHKRPPRASLLIRRRRYQIFNHGPDPTSRHVGAAVARATADGVCDFAAARGRVAGGDDAIGSVCVWVLLVYLF